MNKVRCYGAMTYSRCGFQTFGIIAYIQAGDRKQTNVFQTSYFNRPFIRGYE